MNYIKTVNCMTIGYDTIVKLVGGRSYLVPGYREKGGNFVVHGTEIFTSLPVL